MLAPKQRVGFGGTAIPAPPFYYVILLLVGVFVHGIPMRGQTSAFNGFCVQGGVSSATSGLQSTNKLQGVIPSCTVTVYATGTTTKVTLYKDAIGTPLSNPFTAAVLGSAAPGQWLFYAATGVGVDVTMSGGIAPLVYSQPVTLTDLIVPNGGSGPTGTCGPLDSDSTSTNCGNGNFVSAGTTSNDQAYGFTNMGTLTHPTYSVAIGNNSLVTGSGNNSDVVAVGDFAANNIHGSTDLIAIGDSPAENVNLSDALCIGDGACTNTNVSGDILTGETIVALGDCALCEVTGNTSMNNVIAIGDAAGAHLNASSGTNADLIFLGDGAGENYTGAVHDIVALGNGAGSFNGGSYSPSSFTPRDLVAIGQGAGTQMGGTDVVGIGQASGSAYGAGSSEIVGIGDSSATGSQTGTGPTVLPVADHVIGIGQSAAGRNSGSEVIAIGDWTLGQTNCGSGFTGNTGNYNTAIGDHALAANGSGTHNVVMGYFSGSQGWVDCDPGDAGNSNITGSQNTWVGDNTGPNTATQLSNTIALGYNAQVSASNQTVIGNSSITSLKIFGCPSGQSVLDDGSGTCYVPGSSSFITSLTTTGTSGPATVISGVLNIPQYSGGGSGSFSAITTGTNSGQTLVVGATSTLAPASTGTIQANIITGTIVAGTNISISGSGTVASPYSISASGTVTDGSGTSTAGLIAESTTTLHGIDYNSLLDNGHTTANTLTYSGTGGIKASNGPLISIPTAGHGGSADLGEGTNPFTPTAGHDYLYADSTSHCIEYSANGGSFACLGSGGGGSGFPITLGSTSIAASSTTTTINGFVSLGSQAFVASGSGAGVMTLTGGTAPSTVTNSVNLIAPASVTTPYNFTFPAGPPGISGNLIYQCSGTTAASCSFSPGGSIGYLTASAPYGGFSISGSFAPATFVGSFGALDASDPNLYLNAATGGSVNFKIGNVSAEVLQGGSHPTGSCSGSGTFFVLTTGDGNISYCNNTSYSVIAPGGGGVTAPLMAGQVSGTYYGYSANNTLTAASMLGIFADSTSGDKNLYLNAPTGGGFKLLINNSTAVMTGTVAGIGANTFQAKTIYSAAGTAIPACNSGTHGTIAVVSDSTTPTYLSTYTSGGAVETVVECNGTNWINH